ncbi:TetR family transcriptional regulator [Oceanobacillus jeddahense]|uniref:TetR family transcriptional regulator n=1 Tax=Oceanobacillus jeddahense TaxID=1462527 RepID=A0ABY5JZK1_9BACI|nr:TetR family transcriptional regulator [Oceanobacillus jeddahense]UUI04481.1 TetR family transcriptional regulator [Oceanobacillus jeddahense]
MPKVTEAYKEEKKKELIYSARKVFIRKGYVQTSMQDIMDEAGISRGALYSYFDNIDHIFIEVLKEDDQKDIPFFEVSDNGLLWPQFKQWLKLQQDFIENIHHSLLQAKAEFFLSSRYRTYKENFPYISQRYNKLARAIAEVLVEGEHKKEFQLQQPADFIAGYIISFINGLMLDTFQLGHKQTNVKEQISILCFSLENILRPQSAKKE